MRKLLLGLTLASLALPAAAESISAEMGRAGLGATETRLAALPTPTDEERLALGAVQFLRAIEGSFQTRWAYGMTDRSGMLPLLRMPILDNPTPKDFDPAVVATIFRDAETALARSISTLEPLPDTSPVGLEINLADLWFDVNANGTRDAGEDLAEVIRTVLLSSGQDGSSPSAAPPTIRFDAADGAWLAAYGHLLSGFSNLVLAYDPTEPLTRVLGARVALQEWGTAPPSFLSGSDALPDEIDIIAMALAALHQQPDTARMTAAREHFLAMITQNRRFWRLVDLETDNAQEWLPNARQTAAIGIALPPETGQTWAAVLDDADALLKGDKLIPYWRTGDGGGINLNLLFTNPAPVDVPGWIQGWAALPYMQTGPLVSSDNWNRFGDMMLGDPMLFALWLN